jgi:tetratricopeptide (TPR) repeat protein
MKKIFFLTLTLVLPILSFSQNDIKPIESNFDKKEYLKEHSENACECIESIDTGGKSEKEKTDEIHACIDKQTMSYQLGMKLNEINYEEEAKKGKITIGLNEDKNSTEYKKYYYEIERYLIDNCIAIKTKMNTNDENVDKTGSGNSEAIKYYNLGLDEAENENYKKALELYKKAVLFDDQFAYAYDNIGVCCRKLELYDEAIEAYEKSLKIDPNGTMPLQNIAIVYIYKQEYKKAVKAYERLAKIDSKNPEVFYGIGNIYVQALADYEKGLDNLCQAYNLYVEQKSPYRVDAEKLIQIAQAEMKKQGKIDVFNKILEKYHISQH